LNNRVVLLNGLPNRKIDHYHHNLCKYYDRFGPLNCFPNTNQPKTSYFFNVIRPQREIFDAHSSGKKGNYIISTQNITTKMSGFYDDSAVVSPKSNDSNLGDLHDGNLNVNNY